MTHNIHNGKSTAYYTSLLENTNVKLDTLDTSLATNKRATFSLRDTLEATLTSIENISSSTDSKLDTLETTLTNIETDAAALEVLQTSTNTKLDTLETTLTTIESAVGSSDSTGGPSKVISIGGTRSGGAIKELLVDSDGHLQVDILSGGNDSVKVDDAAFTLGSDSVTMIGGFAGTQSVNANDSAVLACDTSGHLHVRNSTAEGKLDTLETTLTAIETDAAALEVLQTSTNSKLDTIDGVLDNILVDTSAIKVDAAALEVLQTSTNSKLDTLETTCNAIQTAVEIIDNTVSGSEMQVDIVGSIPSGSNAIGKLAANSGVDIGDVDVTSIIPGTGATNLGKAIQSAQGSTDTGIAALVVRNDTLADLAGADHDYAPLQVNSLGSLYTTITYETTLNKAVVTASDASTNELVAAQGSGVKIAIVDIIFSTNTSQNFIISDASTAILGPIYLSTNSTTSINLNRPMILTANQALNYTNNVGTVHSVTVTYFTTT